MNDAQRSYERNPIGDFYAYYDYDRQYHESYGAGHDGNPAHRPASIRREETA
jgi:hypothetical protein